MNNINEVFKALADETRLKMAVHLARRKEEGCQELSKNFNLSQPTLSHHFGKLLAAGVILERKEGKSHYYRINHGLLKKAGVDLKRIEIRN